MVLLLVFMQLTRDLFAIAKFLFERCITNTWDLGSLKNTENEANLLLPLGIQIQKLKAFQLQRGFADQGLCPWTPLGALPPDPRYRLALRARHVCPKMWGGHCPPHIFLNWRRP